MKTLILCIMALMVSMASFGGNDKNKQASNKKLDDCRMIGVNKTKLKKYKKMQRRRQKEYIMEFVTSYSVYEKKGSDKNAPKLSIVQE